MDTDYVFLKVKYDPLLVSPEFMAEHVYELEGVDWVVIEDAN
jgi:hypothetical protein